MNGLAALTSGQSPKSAMSNHSLLQRATKAEVKKIVAARLLEARALNGWTQTEAANRIGYEKPTQLSLWEMARRMPPLEKLVRVSAVYRVSLDYLMGISSEPDRDTKSVMRAQVLSGAEEMLQSSTDAVLAMILRQIETGGPTLEMSYSMVQEGEKLLGVIKRFIELNKVAFEEDMRGSSTLQNMTEQFERNCLVPAREQIERHRRLKPAETARMLKRVRPRDPEVLDMFGIDAD